MKVKRLEGMALKLAYREIVTNLLLCPEHVSHKAKATDSFCRVIPSSSYISLNITSKGIIKFVKDRIDQKLVGTMSDGTRRKLIDMYQEDLQSSHGGSFSSRKNSVMLERPDVWVFLDCVLDETFTELDLTILPPNLLGRGHKLFKTIACRAPYLKDLEIDFDCTEELSEKMQTAFIDCLSSLKNLTNLTLRNVESFLTGAAKTKFLTSLGNSCPHLTHLNLLFLECDEEDLLSLFLGERTELIPESTKQKLWGEDWNNLYKIQIPREYLTPICSSLQQLELWYSSENGKPCFCVAEEGFSTKAISCMAFILRHLSNLNKNVINVFDCCECLEFNAIDLLYKLSLTNSIQAELREEENFHATGNLDDCSKFLNFKWTFNSPFSGIENNLHFYLLHASI